MVKYIVCHMAISIKEKNQGRCDGVSAVGRDRRPRMLKGQNYKKNCQRSLYWEAKILMGERKGVIRYLRGAVPADGRANVKALRWGPAWWCRRETDQMDLLIWNRSNGNQEGVGQWGVGFSDCTTGIMELSFTEVETLAEDHTWFGAS